MFLFVKKYCNSKNNMIKIYRAFDIEPGATEHSKLSRQLTSKASNVALIKPMDLVFTFENAYCFRK